MNITTFLIILSVFATIAIIALVLMQNSKGDMGSAFGGGGSQSMFGSRGSANFLSRSTSVMVTVLFLSCLTLAYIYAKRNAEADTVDPILIQQDTEIPAIDAAPETNVDSGAIPDVPEDAVQDVIESSADTASAAPQSDVETPIDANAESESQDDAEQADADQSN